MPTNIPSNSVPSYANIVNKPSNDVPVYATGWEHLPVTRSPSEAFALLGGSVAGLVIGITAIFTVML